MINNYRVVVEIKRIINKFSDDEFVDFVIEKLVSFPNIIESPFYNKETGYHYNYLLEMESCDEYCGYICIDPVLDIGLQISKKIRKDLIKKLSLINEDELLNKNELVEKSRKCIKNFFTDSLNLLLRNGKYEYFENKWDTFEIYECELYDEITICYKSIYYDCFQKVDNFFIMM